VERGFANRLGEDDAVFRRGRSEEQPHIAAGTIGHLQPIAFLQELGFKQGPQYGMAHGQGKG
jgi:hypothetical protein